jgi:hypothetical protein
MKPILHIVNNKIHNRAHTFLGSVKDINTRIEYFKFRKLSVRTIVPKGNFFLVRKKLKNLNKENFSKVLVEQSQSLLLQIYLFFKFKKVIYRSHNAETYHRFHIFKYNLFHFFNNILFKDTKFSIKKIIYIFLSTFIFFPINILKYFLRDLCISILAESVIAVSKWEKNNYWKYFPFVKKYHADFFLSRFYLKKSKNIKLNKKNIIIISGSYHPNPISYEQIRSIYKLLFLKRKSKLFKKFKFIVTGKVTKGILHFLIKKKVHRIKNIYFYYDEKSLIADKDFKIYKKSLKKYPWNCFNIITSEDLGNYYQLLKIAKAMMFCTEAGFGVKTKAWEAYFHGCFLLMNEKLFAKFPREFDLTSYKYNENDLDVILKKLINYNFPNNNLNRLLKKSAYATYDKVFGYKNKNQRFPKKIYKIN